LNGIQKDPVGPEYTRKGRIEGWNGLNKLD
jgi:hypothetical protein